MITKPFDEQLFNDNDAKGRNAARAIFLKHGYVAITHPNKYAVDLILYKVNKGHIGYVEVGIKHNWIGADFPYNDVVLQQRKLKYINLDKPTFFIMFNTDCSRYLIIRGCDIDTTHIEELQNKYVPYGEMVFKITLDKVSFNNLNSIEVN